MVLKGLRRSAQKLLQRPQDEQTACKKETESSAQTSNATEHQPEQQQDQEPEPQVDPLMDFQFDFADQRLRKAVQIAMQEQPSLDEDICPCGTSEYMHSPSEHDDLPSSNGASPVPQQVDGRQQYEYAYETLPYQRRGNPKLKIPNKRSSTIMNSPTSNIHPAYRVSSAATGFGPSLEMLDARRGRDENGPYVGAHYMNSARTGRRHFRRSVSPKPKSKAEDRKDEPGQT